MHELFVNDRGIRTFTAIAGAQRCGKSFLSNELLKYYISDFGGCGLVYGLGRNTDFADAQMGYILSIQDHQEMFEKTERKSYNENPKINYYKIGNELFPIKNFNLKNYLRGIKVPRLPDRQSERLFISAFFKHIANTLLIIDDSRPIFRYGVESEFIQLFSRINHCGYESPAKNWRTQGSDIISIFHSLEHINNEIFDYLTHIITFRYEFAPDFRRIDNPFLREELEAIFEHLQELPLYYFSLTDIVEKKTTIYDDKKQPIYILQ